MPEKNQDLLSLVKIYVNEQHEKQVSLMRKKSEPSGSVDYSNLAAATSNTLRLTISETKEKLAAHIARQLEKGLKTEPEKQELMRFIKLHAQGLLAKGSSDTIGRAPRGLKIIEMLADKCGYNSDQKKALLESLKIKARLYELFERIKINCSAQEVLAKAAFDIKSKLEPKEEENVAKKGGKPAAPFAKKKALEQPDEVRARIAKLDALLGRKDEEDRAPAVLSDKEKAQLKGQVSNLNALWDSVEFDINVDLENYHAMTEGWKEEINTLGINEEVTALTKSLDLVLGKSDSSKTETDKDSIISNPSKSETVAKVLAPKRGSLVVHPDRVKTTSQPSTPGGREEGRVKPKFSG